VKRYGTIVFLSGTRRRWRHAPAGVGGWRVTGLFWVGGVDWEDGV